jgi:hypothetical protein
MLTRLFALNILKNKYDQIASQRNIAKRNDRTVLREDHSLMGMQDMSTQFLCVLLYVGLGPVETNEGRCYARLVQSRWVLMSGGHEVERRSWEGKHSLGVAWCTAGSLVFLCPRGRG